MDNLLVVGNGFDIDSGLHSKYKDFFNYRYKELFNLDINNDDDKVKFFEKLDNGIREIINQNESVVDADSFSRLKVMNSFTDDHRNNWEDVTRWDLIFLYASKIISKKIDEYQWQDVERVISEVISISLYHKSNDYISSYSKTFDDSELYDYKLEYDNEDDKQLFFSLVKFLSRTKNNEDNENVEELLNELNKFEQAFANFIKKQMDNNSEYFSNVISHLKVLLNLNDLDTSMMIRSGVINVISFNYSFNELFLREFRNEIRSSIRASDLKINWRNIHGLAQFDNPNVKKEFGSENLPKPIFGIDSHELSDNDDLRVMFTKQYRVILENVNGIFNSNDDYSNLGYIKVFGHSLGRADYSYFESIFDQCDLYHSRTKFIYYYYPEESEIESQRMAVKKVVDLLTDYGKSLNDNHGDNLVTKMNLEKRISVIPTTDVSNRSKELVKLDSKSDEC